MKQFQKDGYWINVFEEKTREYYNKLTLCDCSACRNFYAQIKGKYPEAEAFLSGLGVDISKPDELFWWDVENEIECHPAYTVTGSFNYDNDFEFEIGCLKVVISPGGDPRYDVPHEQTAPYFNIIVYPIRLPWVLDEPFPGSESKPLLNKIKSFFSKKDKK